MFDTTIWPERADSGSATPTVVDALVWPAESAAALAIARPGADSVTALAMLRPESLSRAARIDALVTAERAIAWLTGVQQRLLAAMSADAGDPADVIDPSGQRWLASEVGCALHLADGTAAARIEVATELVLRLPDALELLESGGLSPIQARTLAESTLVLDDAQAESVQARVLPRADGQTAGEFRRSVRRAVSVVDVRREEVRHQQAVEQRRVGASPLPDGMAEVYALLPADGAATLMAALDACAAAARSCGGDRRTLDQRRADSLVELGLAALNDPQLPGMHGMRPTVQVTVAASTLLGDDDQPGELAGHGPIPASMARRIAADPSGTWRRLVVDEMGRLLDCGRSTYRPPPELARHVIARDQHCAFPGCQRSAARCDLDHRIPYPVGCTSAENIQPLCRQHHRLKHQSGWQVSDGADGSSQWLAPTGHRYTSTPPAHPVPILELSTSEDPDASAEVVPVEALPSGGPSPACPDEPPPF